MIWFTVLDTLRNISHLKWVEWLFFRNLARYSTLDDSYFNNPMYDTDNQGYNHDANPPSLHFDTSYTDRVDNNYSSVQLHAWWRDGDVCLQMTSRHIGASWLCNGFDVCIYNISFQHRTLRVTSLLDLCAIDEQYWLLGQDQVTTAVNKHCVFVS